MARSKTVITKSSSKRKSIGLLPYRNPKLSPEKRVRDLLSRMTLEEKAAQMVCIWRERPKTLLDDDGNFDPAKAKAAFKKGQGLGQVARPSDAGKGKNARQMADLTNTIQRFFWRKAVSESLSCFTRNACTVTGRSTAQVFPSRSHWHRHLIPPWSNAFLR